jgi:hypothetical protein
MDRQTPSAENEEIELYIRTYYSLLRSSGEVAVRSLEETHATMSASLHPLAESSALDISAFVYTCLRLPSCIPLVRLIVLGQSEEVFESRGGYIGVENWQPVPAAARRRKMFFDGKETLAAFIASVSDIDDLIPIITAYQIEWNKMYQRLSCSSTLDNLGNQEDDVPLSLEEEEDVRRCFEISQEDFDKLKSAWEPLMRGNLLRAGRQQKDFALRLLAGSLTDYRRAAQGWWQNIERGLEDIDLEDSDIYFVSSNTHSLTNLLSGYALEHQDRLVEYLLEFNPENLKAEWDRVKSSDCIGEKENLLYYLLRTLFLEGESGEFKLLRRQHFERIGIHQVQTPLYLDAAAQVIQIGHLVPNLFDPRIQLPNQEVLRESRALIFNVDYPLGMASYHVLGQVSINVGSIKGFYVMGKAATLNGRIGDVMIPNVVYDVHSQNTFLFKNSFRANHIGPYLHEGTVFDNQKAVTVRGTFQQNNRFMTLFYREGYTDIEMEAGPYLSGLYENIYPKRFPINEIVNLFINAPYDIGFLHYASDTPYSRRQTLLSKSLSYFGMDSTYACATAILRHILGKEIQEITDNRERSS